MELICPMRFNSEGRKGQSGEVVSYDAYGRIVGAPQEKTSDVTPLTTREEDLSFRARA